MAWNNLTSETIEVGTELKLTAPVAEVQTESVQPITQTNAPVQQASAPKTACSSTSFSTSTNISSIYSTKELNHMKRQRQQSYKAPPKSYNTPVNGNVAQIARSVAVGKSYVYGANSATAVDCSAFAQQVLAAQGKSIPRTTYAQMAAVHVFQHHKREI